MEVSIKWFNDQFNVILSSKAGAEPFLEVKGCRVVNGQNGPFVSWPSTKNQNTGKYWNHAYASEKFNAVVLEKAQAGQPQQQRSGGGQRARQDDMDSDVPF
jgi:DNA-binding cell septation regulator SpoVG